jgi:hypothetical protein
MLYQQQYRLRSASFHSHFLVYTFCFHDPGALRLAPFFPLTVDLIESIHALFQPLFILASLVKEPWFNKTLIPTNSQVQFRRDDPSPP